jgi:hypothetical protein
MRRVAIALFFLAVACSHADAEPLPNVRLGMSPRDVRDRFAPGGDGNWQSQLGSADDTFLEWTSSTSKVDHARFEFHLGMLVAIRAHLREPSTGEHIDTTSKTVTLRAPAAGGTDVTVLARDCPTHKEEADSLARRAAR